MEVVNFMGMTSSPDWEQLKSLLKKCSDLVSDEKQFESAKAQVHRETVSIDTTENVVELISNLIEKVAELEKRLEKVESRIEDVINEKSAKISRSDEGETYSVLSSKRMPGASIEEIRNSIRSIREQIRNLKSKYSSDEPN